jgi:hypothetical protein
LDARKFKNFADFDNLFLFNPFDDDIYAQVISAVTHQILQSDLSKPRYIICHCVYNIEAMKSSGLFSLIREDCCPYRGNLFRVFKSIDNA